MIGLCQIPTCRQRNRHLPSCTDDCLGCLPRLATEGIVCDQHLRWAAESLALIITLCPDARAVAAGLVRHGSGGGGKPGSRSPGNDDAMDALTNTHNKLTRLCIHIAVTRGLRFHVPCLTDCVQPTPSQAHCSVCHLTFGGIGGFDRHRRDGQCLTPEAIGYHRDDRGVYRAPMDERGKARLARLREPQTAERAELVPAPTPDYPESEMAL